MHVFYPTYEEWKLHMMNIIKEIKEEVLILPMRNGNHEITAFGYCLIFACVLYPTYEGNGNSTFLITYRPKLLWFSFYLWGMETILSIHSNQFLKIRFLSYLLRNGNASIWCGCNPCFYLRSYPTLWGMETTSTENQKLWKISSPYPTYEEWNNTSPFQDLKGEFMFLSYPWGMET